MSLPSGSGTEVGREGLYGARQHEGSSVVGILQVHCQNQKSPVQTGTSNQHWPPTQRTGDNTHICILGCVHFSDIVGHWHEPQEGLCSGSLLQAAMVFTRPLPLCLPTPVPQIRVERILSLP